MSKTSLIIGAIASVALHALVFAPQAFSVRPKASARPQVKPKGALVVAMAKPVAEADPRRRKPTPERAAKAPVEMEQVHRLRGRKQGSASSGDMASEDTASLPSMNIVWTGPEQVRAVARSLGMKIVAIRNDDRIAGAITLNGDARLIPVAGGLSGFSNRVRILPAQFFGAVAGESIKCLWVLVPVAVDARFAQVQRDAIQIQGLAPAAVSSMKARFQKDRWGGYTLVVTGIRPKPGRQVDHG